MFKRTLVHTANSLLRPFGAQITRLGNFPAPSVANSERRDPSTCYMDNPALRKMLTDELAEIARTFFSQHLANIAPKDFNFQREAESFLTMYSARDHENNVGGSGFHNTFWIYLFTKALQPELIVESGVWKGHTTHMLGQICPTAKIHGFDISLACLEYKGGRAEFHEHDWSSFDLGKINPDKSFVYFDCHFNHARRLLEAKAKGFKHVIFDDNPAVHKLYSYGMPGFPTANMLNSGIGLDLPEIKWRWHKKEMSYKFDRAEAEAARKVIQQHEIFPDVSGPTRYGAFSYSYLTYVRIRS